MGITILKFQVIITNFWIMDGKKLFFFLVTEKVSAECGFTFIMEACFCHWKVKNLDYYLKISTS